MFRYGGKQYQKSLKTTDRTKAEQMLSRVEEVLDELDRGRRVLPEGADLWEFLRSDGQRTRKVEAPTVVTLDQLFTRYEQEMPPGTMEASSLATVLLHKKHLLRLVGGRTPVQTLSTTILQGYINGRAKEEYRGKPISSKTIKKEVTTFRIVWNWGKDHGIVTGDAPTKGLRYEKEEPKMGFMTWEEIERVVGRGGLTQRQVDELWRAVFLSTEQVSECLEFVRTKPAAPFVYPMFVFVSHTGARRSEVIRSRVEDIDFEAKRVRLRERKRDKTKKETYRYVPMTQQLERVLRDWLHGGHPGGPHTFCHTEVVRRSRKRSRTTGHQTGPGRATTLAGRNATVSDRVTHPGPAALTKDEATHHFGRALAGSKWEVLPGFHAFRHSFASNMARAGVDQRLIDAYMGHQTEEMRNRYRHLFPQDGANVLRAVYG